MISTKLKSILLLSLNILLFFNYYTTFAQKQNNQWRYGNGGAIDFNTVPPSFVTGAAISTGEGSASIADRTTGALLFYTDGVTVWNSINQVMPNGTGLLGGTDVLLSSTTAAVIVPKPGSANLFYLITIDEQSSNNGIRFSVVDMTLNGGLGDIIVGQKNIFLFQTGSEKLEVVPASDGSSYWLITHDNPGDTFFTFKIDNSGIQTTPVISQIGGNHGNGAGHMKINKQFNKIAIGLLNLGAGSTTQIELFDFNNTTGLVSNATIWNYNFQVGLIYGVEFSPNGKVLYVSDLQQIVQYDISQPTITAIENSAYQFTSGGFSQPATLQLGIDNKIYINTGAIDAINCPNKLGIACGFQQNVIANQTGGGGYGLPKWVYYQDDVPTISTNAITYSDSCFGSSTQFSIQNIDGIIGVNWVFDDVNSGANTATGLNVSHVFSQVGSYNVRAILTNSCGLDTLFFNNLQIVNCNSPNDQCDVFQYTGAAQQWTVPSGVDTIRVKMWGGAGGGGPDPAFPGQCAGGGGGYTEFSLTVIPGDVLQITVGAGGQTAIGNTGGNGGWPAGGNGGNGNKNELFNGIPIDVGGAGGGGGRTEIRITGSINQLLAIAGAGGGAAFNRAGGAGGGLQAEFTTTSNQFELNGFGGSQTAGGAPANNALCPPTVFGQPGISLGGGNGANNLANLGTGAGGGGDGYFGGGGGSSDDGCSGVGSTGGGGSGYLCATCPGLFGNTLTGDFFGVPANLTDPLLSSYPGTAAGVNNTNGGNGLVQICYTSVPCSPTTATIIETACSNYTAPWGVTYNQTGNYSDTIVNSDGCDSIIQLNLTITGLPIVAAESDSASCGLPNGTATAIATGGSGNYSYTWSNGATGSFVTGLAAGSYSVIANDQNGCTASVQVSVSSTSASGVSLIANDTFLEYGDSVNLQIFGANTYLWSPPDGLSCTNCSTVIASPLASTVYQITGTDSSGCSYLLNVKLEVEIELNEIFVPDAFSPNSDGINDKVFVRGSIKEFSFSVFNRWGEIVFRTQNQSQGWDGFFRGKELDAGVFVYYLSGTDAAGNSFNKKGNITLVK
jgi:gliding motility-associated-like protein